MFKKHFVTMTLLVLLACFIHWRWFYQPTTILTHGDWWSINHEEMLELWNKPSIITNDNFGTINLGLSMYPISLMYGFLYKFISFGLIERIVYFWPAILIAPIGSYAFGWYLTHNKKASILQSIAYTYSSYFLLIRTGHLTLAVCFAWAPLIFLSLFLTFKRPNLLYALMFALTSVIAGAYEIRGLYLIALGCLVFCLTYTLYHRNQYKHLLKVGAYLLFATSVIILCNLYWLVGYISIDYFGTHNPLFQRGLFNGNLMSMYRAVSSFHPLWSNGRLHEPFQIEPTPFYFFLIPCLAFLPIRKRQSISFYPVVFSIIAIIGIFLTKMDQPPWSWVYGWLYVNLPGFGAFRESSKFYFYITLAYASLIGISYTNLVKHFPHRINAHRIFLIIVVCIFLSNTLTFVNGSIGTIFVPRTTPDSYEALKPYYRGKPGLNRVLMIPSNSRWLSLTQDVPYVNYTDFVEFARKYIKDVDVTTAKLSDRVQYQFAQPKVLSFLAAWSFRYIIVPINDPSVAEDFFTRQDDRRSIIAFFEKNPHFTSTLIKDKSGQDLALFELIDPEPLKLSSRGPGYTARLGNDVIVSARFSKNWLLKTTGGYRYATEDRFGRVIFRDVEDEVITGLIFRPQTVVDRFVGLSFSIFGICFVLTIYLLLKNRKSVQ